MEDNLCKRYTALTPFILRREKSGEVFLLVRRINASNERANGIGKKDTVWTDSKGTRHIRRPATNDDWY